MKITAIVVIGLALLVGALPVFTDCESQGRHLTLQNGREIPMKCHWTGVAELATAAPLLVTGLMLGTSQRRETLRNGSLMAALFGAVVILLPTRLIGVCANPDMMCNSTMKAGLILLGSVVLVLGLVGAARSLRWTEEMREPAPASL